MDYLNMTDAELRRHLRFKMALTDDQKRAIVRLEQQVSFQAMIIEKQHKRIKELGGEK